MSTIHPLLPPLLLSLACLAYYGTWHRYAVSGGLDAIVAAAQDPSLALYASATDTTTPLIRYFTGFTRLDNFLSLLILTFHPLVSGISPSGALFSFHFSGQLIPVAAIMYTDMYRRGNVGCWWLSPTAWITLAQACAFANMAPWWVAVYVWTSPVLRPGAARKVRELNVVEDPIGVVLLPASIVLGHVVPCIGMAARGISGITTQWWITIWQVFPVWIALGQWMLRPAARSLGLDVIFVGQSKERAHLSAVRFTYGVALACSTFSHLFTIGLTLVAQYTPEIFASGVVDHFQLARVLVPRIAYGYSESDATGAWTEAIMDFLQWDQAVAFGTVLVWSAVVYATAKEGRGRSVPWIAFVPALALCCLLLGPGGTAAVVMWMKEESLFAEDGEDDSKKVK